MPARLHGEVQSQLKRGWMSLEQASKLLREVQLVRLRPAFSQKLRSDIFRLFVMVDKVKYTNIDDIGTSKKPVNRFIHLPELLSLLIYTTFIVQLCSLTFEDKSDPST